MKRILVAGLVLMGVFSLAFAQHRTIQVRLAAGATPEDSTVSLSYSSYQSFSLYASVSAVTFTLYQHGNTYTKVVDAGLTYYYQSFPVDSIKIDRPNASAVAVLDIVQ